MPDFSSDIESCLQTLRSGGIILYPTDTIWGIGCDATDPVAVGKVYALKKRPEKKSMIVLLADERDVLKYVSQPDPAIFNFLQSTRKPTTVIYSGAVGLAQNLGEDGTIAIRVVKDDFCKQLIKRFRKPIVSTSANISGQEPPAFFDEVQTAVRQGVDYIVQYRRDEKVPGEPSSIVRFNRDGTLTVIRD
ncbi:MAG TPA: L-threonylcarbamoyladenylate synthase [Puia sp.]|nr:L-threonylcarbamoyladenylate synthase [Puia sp.]